MSHVEHRASCETSVRFLVQTEGKRPYALTNGKVCSKCHKNPPRPGQRTCAKCHAENQRAYRARRKTEWDALRAKLAIFEGAVP